MQIPPKFGIKKIKRPKKFDIKPEDVKRRIQQAKEILSLSRDDYRKVVENRLEHLLRGVKAFRVIAERIINTREPFYLCPILAGIKDEGRDKHIIPKLSENSDALPIYIKTVAYIDVQDLLGLKLLVPATRDASDPENFNEIAKEQRDIILQTIDEVDPSYKDLIIKFELDPQTPSPAIRVFGRDGCWIVWNAWMKRHEDFWTHDLTKLVLADKIPFVATPVYEFVIPMSDSVNRSQLEYVKNKLVENAKQSHGVELAHVEEIEISYAWLVSRNMIDEILRIGKIDERIASAIREDSSRCVSSNGSKAVASSIMMDETGKTPEEEVDVISYVLEEPTIVLYPEYRYDDETYRYCVIKKSDLK